MASGARRLGTVTRLDTRAKLQRVRGHRVGVLVACDERGLVVDFAGNPHGPLVARSTTGLPPDAEGAVGRSVLLVFEEERSDSPIVVGWLDPSPPAPAARAPAKQEAVVDGQRVVIEAQDEIVFRCGEATITLRRNGRVVIRGAYVETRSRGVNRIKGGTVQIN
jgi:hypothetical protein